MPWFDKLNRGLIKRFGVPITYSNRLDEVALSAIPSSSNAVQERLQEGYLSLQFELSALGVIVPTPGHRVKTTTLYGKPFAAEWSVVEVDPRQENWVRLTVQKLRDL